MRKSIQAFLVFSTSSLWMGAAVSAPDVPLVVAPAAAADASSTHLVAAPFATDSSLKELYSNLNSDPDHLYDCHVATGIYGSQAWGGGRTTVGVAFTPDVDAIVRKIDVGLHWDHGTNAFTVSLRADADGVPGDVLHTFQLSDLPPFDDDCSSLARVSTQGIPVKAGTVYWVVVKAYGDTSGGWNQSFPAVRGPVAQNQGDGVGWYLFPEGLKGAFRVLGDD
jgi:hypothetical protein